MFTTVEAEATVGGIVNDGTLNTAQVQTFKKGKIMYWGADKTGIYITLW